MFIGPWDQGGPWDTQAIEGVHRFLHRVWAVVTEDVQLEKPLLDAGSAVDAAQERALERKLHQTILKVTDDIENFRFNTAIAAMMEFNNTLFKARETAVVNTVTWNQAVRDLMLMMAPIFPHIADELWHRQGNTSSVHRQRWPIGDPEKAREEEITVVVQINGKVRDKLVVAPGTPGEELERQALALSNIVKWMDGKSARKIIVVPDKLVNIVMG